MTTRTIETFAYEARQIHAAMGDDSPGIDEITSACRRLRTLQSEAQRFDDDLTAHLCAIALDGTVDLDVARGEDEDGYDVPARELDAEGQASVQAATLAHYGLTLDRAAAYRAAVELLED